MVRQALKCVGEVSLHFQLELNTMGGGGGVGVPQKKKKRGGGGGRGEGGPFYFFGK